MKTRRVFAEDRYVKTLEADILQVDREKSTVVLDSTIFFPEGGGQSCDLGSMKVISGEGSQGEGKTLSVVDVRERDGIIYHKVEGDVFGLEAGGRVLCQIDWDRRFLNMQRHCGEHILSGIFHRLYGGVNRGFHMGADYMTIDISLEDMPEVKELTWGMVLEAEREANKVIWQDAPVIVRHFDTREQAENLPLRKKLAIDEDITIVCVGSIEEPSDCVACCGTHPNTAGQVGLIKILKMESYKGMYRIYCEAGEAALNIFDSHHQTLTELCGRYSAAPETLMEKIEVAERKNQALKDQLYKLKTALIREKTQAIKENIEWVANPAHRAFYHIRLQGLTPDDLQKIGGETVKTAEGLLVLEVDGNNLLLFSPNQERFHCGNLVKNLALPLGGKGGGKGDQARCFFGDEESKGRFLAELERALKTE